MASPVIPTSILFGGMLRSPPSLRSPHVFLTPRRRMCWGGGCHPKQLPGSVLPGCDYGINRSHKGTPDVPGGLRLGQRGPHAARERRHDVGGTTRRPSRVRCLLSWLKYSCRWCAAGGGGGSTSWGKCCGLAPRWILDAGCRGPAVSSEQQSAGGGLLERGSAPLKRTWIRVRVIR